MPRKSAFSLSQCLAFFTVPARSFAGLLLFCIHQAVTEAYLLSWRPVQAVPFPPRCFLSASSNQDGPVETCQLNPETPSTSVPLFLRCPASAWSMALFKQVIIFSPILEGTVQINRPQTGAMVGIITGEIKVHGNIFQCSGILFPNLSKYKILRQSILYINA